MVGPYSFFSFIIQLLVALFMAIVMILNEYSLPACVPCYNDEAEFAERLTAHRRQVRVYTAVSMVLLFASTCLTIISMTYY